MKSSFLFAAVATSAALIVPTVAEAQEVNSVSVSYADLNLRNEAGASTLERRIANAAGTVCGREDMRQLKQAAEAKQCRNEAIAGAQPALEAALRSARRGTVTVASLSTIQIVAR